MILSIFIFFLVYFITKGVVGLVLPRFNNLHYKLFGVGQTMGVAELSGTEKLLLAENDEKMMIANNQSLLLVRKFTAMTLKTTEMLCISVTDFLAMKIEFSKEFDEILAMAKKAMVKDIILKINKIQQ